MAIALPTDSRMYTIPTRRAVLALNTMFPGVTTLGIYNRRKIAGYDAWSQHSWGNAVDISAPRGMARPSYNDSSSVLQARYRPQFEYLDAVYEYLQLRRSELRIRTILWRTRNHYNHIHIDFYPRMGGTPPVLGPNEEDELFKEYITALQEDLNEVGFRDYEDKPLVVDGIWGKRTRAALKSVFAQVAGAEAPRQLLLRLGEVTADVVDSG